ncbi:MAG: hypothetical protein H6977_16155 [Gammaproteobacteria bacterium]|nr:hypothetical protein [Gammaproteobacteria bacterium]MCP5201537.1 hypothetical protein [Gammaproteobacteria bacterium]
MNPAAGTALVLALAAWCCAVRATPDYRVEVAPDLASLRVTACLGTDDAGFAPRAAAALGYLRTARALPDDTPLAPRDGRLVPATGQRCLRYTIDLAAAAAADRRYRALAPGNRAVPVPTWLWTPAGGAADAEIHFELPPGVRVSVPWIPLEEPATWRIPPSPRSDDAVIALGAFTRCTFSQADTRFDVAVLRGPGPHRPAMLARWLATAVATAARAHGRLGARHVQVVVVPVADADEAVPFGQVIRDGGSAVQFFVDAARAESAFLADWTAPHEFSHLLLPYVEADAKWVAEGLASYYQNVLMARAGSYDEARAWAKLVAGFGRGEHSVPALSLDDALPVGGWDGIMKTYWGGAAVFLLADVELRRRSAGAAGLDQALAGLAACCLPSPRTWTAPDLFAALDAQAPFAVFTPLYARHHAAAAFPAWRPALRALGVVVGDDGSVTLDDGAPDAALRRAIMDGGSRSPVPLATCADG